MSPMHPISSSLVTNHDGHLYVCSFRTYPFQNHSIHPFVYYWRLAYEKGVWLWRVICPCKWNKWLLKRNLRWIVFEKRKITQIFKMIFFFYLKKDNWNSKIFYPELFLKDIFWLYLLSHLLLFLIFFYLARNLFKLSKRRNPQKKTCLSLFRESILEESVCSFWTKWLSLSWDLRKSMRMSTSMTIEKEMK